MTLYAFLGIESASIPAGNVSKAEKTIPFATMFGTLISTLIYVFGTIILFGILPSETLINSPAPFAEAGKLMGGNFVGYLVSAGAAVSAIGALNGWILITSYMPMTISNDKLFPKIFEKKNKKGFPIVSLILGSILSSVVMTMNFNDGLVNKFEFLILLTTLSTLIPYFFVSASFVIYHLNKKFKYHSLFIGLLGTLYSVWAVFGSGIDSIYYGTILLLLGVPIYFYMKLKKP